MSDTFVSESALRPREVDAWLGPQHQSDDQTAKLSRNAACCERCWFEWRGNREPTRMRESGVHVCSFCGRPTWVGIFVRVNPHEVPYPRIEDD